jgi:HEAT repeat protein
MRPRVQPTLLLYAVLAGTIPAGTPAESERQLVAILQSSAPLYERVQACRQLARIGGANSVAPLAAVLPDDKLSAYAREALEAIPLPAAAQALRDALPRLQGDLLGGVINSLAARRDEQAVQPLSALVRDSNPEIAAAALIALGRVGTAPAIELLQQTMARGTPECREAAAEGCLLAAQQHWRDGDADRAAPLYDAVRRVPLAAQLRATATRGAILARRVAGLALLLEQLHASEDALRDAALAAARELPDPAVTTALMAELDKGDPTLQVLLIGALVDRGGAGVRAALEKKINAPSEEVRVATLQALGDAGGDSTVPLLLAAIGASSAREAGAAFQSLSRINAGNVQAAILQFLPSASPPLAARLISVIGERNDPGAADELLKLARNPEPDISKAALRALALAARPGDVPELTRLAARMPDQEGKTLAARPLVTAAMKVPDVQERTDLVVQQLEQAPDAETRFVLLLPLGVIVRSTGGNERALAAVQATLADAAPQVREAALRALANWPNAAPCLALVDFSARSDVSSAQREIALQAAARMAANLAARREPARWDALAVFQRIDRVARTKDEKLSLVDGLASLRRIEAVRMLARHFEDPAVRPRAAAAVIQIAPVLLPSEHGAEIKALLQRIGAGVPDEEIRQAARRLLDGPSAGLDHK